MIDVLVCQFQRTASATVYAAGQIIGTAGGNYINFNNASSRGGGGGYLISAHLIKGSLRETGASFRLWLYSEPPLVAAAADYANFDTQAFTNNGENLLLGYVDFVCNTVGQGTSQKALHFVNNINMAYKTGNRSIYGVLVCTAAYVPEVSELITLKLLVDQF